MKKEYIAGTIGMMATHPNLGWTKLVRVEFHRTKSGIVLEAISGHSLGKLKKIPEVVISPDEFNDRPDNEQDEFFWAIKLLGFSLADSEEVEDE